jgi:hypothetical protein
MMKLVERLAKEQIPLTLCHFQIKIDSKPKDYPLRKNDECRFVGDFKLR